MAGMQETDHVTLKNGITYLLQDAKARAQLAELLAEVMEKYGADNPPPYPVTSVNGQTGDVVVQGGSGSGIAIQDDEPTDGELVWIDTDDPGTTHIIPEIDDTQESAVDTWSSQKIAEKFAGVLPFGEVETKIPSGANLNDYDLPGVYAIATSSIASTIANIPQQNAGTLRVFSSNGGNISASSTWKYLIQEYITFTGERYQRYGNSGSGTAVTWGAWKTVHPITLAALNGVSKDAVDLSSGADLNDYRESGFYYIRTGVTNAPGNWLWLIVCNGAGTMQMCVGVNRIYVRCYTGSPLAWTNWRSVALS